MRPRLPFSILFVSQVCSPLWWSRPKTNAGGLGRMSATANAQANIHSFLSNSGIIRFWMRPRVFCAATHRSLFDAFIFLSVFVRPSLALIYCIAWIALYSYKLAFVREYNVAVVAVDCRRTGKFLNKQKRERKKQAQRKNCWREIVAVPRRRCVCEIISFELQKIVIFIDRHSQGTWIWFAIVTNDVVAVDEACSHQKRTQAQSEWGHTTFRPTVFFSHSNYILGFSQCIAPAAFQPKRLVAMRQCSPLKQDKSIKSFRSMQWFLTFGCPWPR